MFPEIREMMTFRQEGLVLYRASLPPDSSFSGYPQNFSRDVLEAAITAKDPLMVRDQLIYGNRHQARAANPLNGAEPWKYHHQLPEVMINGGLSTAYCATDSTAYYLIDHAFYQKETGDASLTRRFRSNLQGAVEVYVASHLNPFTHQFEEDPKFCGAEEFALKRTDWKDSLTPGREDGRVVYPVVYPTVQALYMKALRDASFLFDTSEFAEEADRMKGGLRQLFDEQLGCFYIAKDRLGPSRGINSDGLNMLVYLELGDITFEQLEDIILASTQLETAAGFLNLDPEIAEGLTDDYHARVWPKEQANIHHGASKWKKLIEREGPNHLLDCLDYVLEVSSRVVKFLDTYPETLRVKNGTIEKAGCDPQLWTVTAKQYFNSQVYP